MPTAFPLSISIVVVSDFEPGEKTWKDEMAIVHALANQDLGVRVPLIVVENAASEAHPPPPTLADTYPGVRVIYHDADTSAAMKDRGVAACETEWVAVLEADAIPERDWLRRLVEASAAHPEFDVITGRTHYGTESSWRRVLNLLDRSWDDCGRSGSTPYISNNGALYRTSVLTRFPYPDAATPFLSARLRNERILAAGHRAYFERAAVMRHSVGGADFVVQFRRHQGFADMMMTAPPGGTWIPRLLYRRAADDIARMWRLRRDYWRWYDWPLGLLVCCFARIPEAIGMIEALRVGSLSRSSYR